MPWWHRAFALFFLAFSAFFMIGSWGGPIFKQTEAKPMVMTIAVVLPLIGIGLTFIFFTTTIRFTSDEIEHHTIFSTKRLPLSEIRGRREYVVRGEEGGSARYLKLVPDDDRLPTLDFMKNYTFDDKFYLWFYELPNLDAEDKKVHKDSNFGLV
jgi:hypothetical protein